ncbi:hypothetical protein ACFL2P_03150 [Candidatus Moduliflexota bacterium]
MAKKGGAYVCIPCGMEIVVTEEGATFSEIICCGEIMAPTPKKAVKKKAPAKKGAGKKERREEENGKKESAGKGGEKSRPEEIKRTNRKGRPLRSIIGEGTLYYG